MADYTDNLGLKKPATTEHFDLEEDINNVRDLIDQYVGTSGVATLPAGSTEVQVTHNFKVGGVATEPDCIEITPFGDVGYWYIALKDSSTFTVRFSSAPSSDVQFCWKAHKKTEV